MGEAPLYRYTGMTAAEMMPMLENVDVLIMSSTYCGIGAVTGANAAECEVMTTQTNSLSLCLSRSLSLSFSHTHSLSLPASINPFLPPPLPPCEVRTPARERRRVGGGGGESLLSGRGGGGMARDCEVSVPEREREGGREEE
jgi:hypothetical protein